MSPPRYPQLLARLVARKKRDEAPPPLPSARMAEIGLLQRAIVERAARRRTARNAGFGAAAALAFAGALTAHFSLPKGDTTAPEPAKDHHVEVVASANGSGTVVPPTGAPVPLASDTLLAPGSRLHVGPVAGARLALSTGTRIAIEPGSDIAVMSHGQAAIFSLTGGALRAEVAKLGPDERFVVKTADSEVEVRGTSFRVGVVPPDPACGEGTTTRVVVYEGIVVVREHDRTWSVRKGDEWPSGCAMAAVKSNPLPIERTNVAAPRVEPRAALAKTPTATSPLPPEPSSLAEENDQFAEAMFAKRSSDAAGAIAAFDHFLAKHPASHLAENASAERMKLLSGIDRARAAAAARQYLVKYPSGFARDEAESILAGRASR